VITPFERHSSSSAARSRYHWCALSGSRCGVWGLRCGVEDSGFRVLGLGRIQGSGFWVSGFGVRN